jgi:hypothetical protein
MASPLTCASWSDAAPPSPNAVRDADGMERVAVDAPGIATADQRRAVTSAAIRGAEAVRRFLGVAAATTPLEVRWGADHEGLGRELGSSIELLDDPAQGPVTFTFGTSHEDGLPAWPIEPSRVEHLAFRAGAQAQLRRHAADVPVARRSALAEALVDPCFPADAFQRIARLTRAGGGPSPAAAPPDPRASPELLRLVEGSLLAPHPDASTWRAPDLDAWRRRLDSASLPDRARAAVPVGLRGFCFAHEGYAWIDGYGSRAAARSLEAAAKLGANAVSLTPFAFQRDAAAPPITLLHERRPGRGAPEHDAALAATAEAARSVGMTVALKPHLWCGNHRWCGEIAMRSETDWEAWFREFERFALHYAALAQRLTVPLLVIGTELKGTTHREREWRALIGRVRSLFDGVLTYSANWGDEILVLPFWDAFDVIGVSAYWPLADQPGTPLQSVEARFRSLQDELRALAARHARPLWFNEIGFPDVREPWISPHRHDGDPDGGADQALACDLVLRASEARAFPDALFWWKWPSDLAGLPRPGRHDFWPCGRPAEEVFRRAWSSGR